MDRDFAVEFVFCCAQLQTHLARLAEDLIHFASPEYGFVKLPEAFTTGSSLMPQKKNPDALELVRGKAARVDGDLVRLLALLKGLPAGYQKDLQEDKEAVFDAADTALGSVAVMTGVIAGLAPQREAMRAAASAQEMIAANLAVALAREGMPFRKAHHVVGSLVGEAQKSGRTLKDTAALRLPALSPAVAARLDAIFDPLEAVKTKALAGRHRARRRPRLARCGRGADRAIAPPPAQGRPNGKTPSLAPVGERALGAPQVQLPRLETYVHVGADLVREAVLLLRPQRAVHQAQVGEEVGIRLAGEGGRDRGLCRAQRPCVDRLHEHAAEVLVAAVDAVHVDGERGKAGGGALGRAEQLRDRARRERRRRSRAAGTAPSGSAPRAGGSSRRAARPPRRPASARRCDRAPSRPPHRPSQECPCLGCTTRPASRRQLPSRGDRGYAVARG